MDILPGSAESLPTAAAPVNHLIRTPTAWFTIDVE